MAAQEQIGPGTGLGGAPKHALSCPRCGARLRVIRTRRIIRRRVAAPAASVAARPAPAARTATRTSAGLRRAKGSFIQRIPSGNMWWGGVAVLVMALLLGEAFAANIPSHPGTAPTGSRGVAYSVDRSRVSSNVTSSSGATLVFNSNQQVTAVTVRGHKTTDGKLVAKANLKDAKGVSLASGQAALPETSGDFSLAVPVEPPTIAYNGIADVSVVFGK